jgi:hypothetical protein
VIAYGSDAPFQPCTEGQGWQLHFRIGFREPEVCGRYRLSRRKQLIAEYFETDNEVDWEPRYNIPPSYDLWLDPAFTDVKALAELLAPFDAAKMRSFPVSSRINAVANDDPDCVVLGTEIRQPRMCSSGKSQVAPFGK